MNKSQLDQDEIEKISQILARLDDILTHINDLDNKESCYYLREIEKEYLPKTIHIYQEIDKNMRTVKRLKDGGTAKEDFMKQLDRLDIIVHGYADSLYTEQQISLQNNGKFLDSLPAKEIITKNKLLPLPQKLALQKITSASIAVIDKNSGSESTQLSESDKLSEIAHYFIAEAGEDLYQAVSYYRSKTETGKFCNSISFIGDVKHPKKPKFHWKSNLVDDSSPGIISHNNKNILKNILFTIFPIFVFMQIIIWIINPNALFHIGNALSIFSDNILGSLISIILLPAVVITTKKELALRYTKMKDAAWFLATNQVDPMSQSELNINIGRYLHKPKFVTMVADYEVQIKNDLHISLLATKNQ